MIYLAKKKEMGSIQLRGRIVPFTNLELLPLTLVKVHKYRTTSGEEKCFLTFGAEEKRVRNRRERNIFKIGKYFHHYVTFPVGNHTMELGRTIDQDFSVGEFLSATSFTKGKGFQGVIKRWSFAGGPATMGSSQFHRKPGSLGSERDPARVLPGKKMPGRMGNKKVTIKGLEVLNISGSRIILKGSVPGWRDGLVLLRKGNSY